MGGIAVTLHQGRCYGAAMLSARSVRTLAASSLLVACAARSTPPKAAPSAPPAPEASADTRGLRTRPAPGTNEVERIYTLAPTAPTPQRGRDDAKVAIEVCSDFECPFCARLVPTLHEIEQNYGEFVRITWRNCPLPFHEFALPAAEAAREVMAQGGSSAFWAFHDLLFAHQDALAPEQLAEYAKSVPGIDGDKVLAAVRDHRHIGLIKSELMGLVDSGATSQGFGTPATFVNGRLLSGAQPYEKFEDAVEKALAETPTQRAEAVANSAAAYPMARARHIMVQWKGAEGADASVVRSKEEAYQRALEVQKKLLARSGDFASLAKEYSNCPSAAQGGELGRVTRGEFVPEFEAVLFTLAPHELSGVVESAFGYHVIEREE
jgi:protein-disulfide isomerase